MKTALEGVDHVRSCPALPARDRARAYTRPEATLRRRGDDLEVGFKGVDEDGGAQDLDLLLGLVRRRALHPDMKREYD